MEELEGDLQEVNSLRLAKGYSKTKASLLLWRDVLKCFKPYALRQKKKQSSMSLYSSYFKMARRHAWKNKGPVLINIIGLASQFLW